MKTKTKPVTLQTHEEKLNSFKEVVFEAAQALRKVDAPNEAAERLLLLAGYFIGCSHKPVHE